MNTKLILLLSSAATVAIALPVTANHNSGLRGMFNGNNVAAYQSHYVAPNSWQARRLQAQGATYLEQGPYVQTQITGYSVQHDGAVHVAQHGHQSQGLNLRGYSDPHSVRYNQQAAADFNRDYNIGGVTVRTNALHSRDMLDWQESTTGKTMTLLANRANGTLASNSLYLGGGMQGGFMYQKTNVDGAFPLLGRFPDFSATTDDEAGVFAINHAALSLTSTFGDWTTVYLQPEYSETEFGGQAEFQLRKAFVVFGNLQKSPFYAAFGRKTIDFGNFDSYNAFTLNEGQHFFQAVSDQPVLELGMYSYGFKLTGSVFSGGRQLRVAYAEEENNIANYAFNAEKEFRLGEDFIGGNAAFTVGGGYLHDTIYRNNFTAHTFAAINSGPPPANFIRYRNSAVNAFAEYNSDFFDAMVEYTTTLEPWAAAIPQLPDGTPFPQYLIDPTASATDLANINFDEKLSTIVAQARIKPMLPSGRRMAVAASGSWGNIGDDFGNPIFGSSFQKNQQHALSLEYPVTDFLDIGAEYVYNKGFIPFVAPQIISNDQVEAHALNVGFKARF